MSQPSVDPTRPNILFITSHDLGRHLGCYGRETVPSPSLDNLAREGLQFDNSFCTAPQCSPSRAALHTGRYQHDVGVLGLAHSPFEWRLDPPQAHLAHRLQQEGYRTVLVGGQHVTRKEDLGRLGFQQWGDVVPAPQVAQEAAAFLADAAQQDAPFYLEVGFFEAHRPYDWGGATPYDGEGVALPPYIPDAPPAVAEFAALQGAIRVLDRAVGDILARLEALDLAHNTLVLFTADHGLAMPRAKCTLYDPGIATPLILRWPAAGIAGGRRLAPLVSHVDVVPTLLEALDLSAPPGLHGRSFWPLLQGAPYEARDAVFAAKTYHTAYEPQRAVRTAGHKLIVNLESGSRYDVADDIRLSPIYPLVRDDIVGERPPVECYDLVHDPLERHNLAGDPGYAEVEEQLRRRLWQWMQETGDPLRHGPLRSPFYHKSRAYLGQDASS